MMLGGWITSSCANGGRWGDSTTMDLPSYFGNSPGGRVRLLFLTALGLFSSLTTVEGQRRFRPDSISYSASGTGHGQLRGVEANIDSAGDTAIFRANGTVWKVSCGED